MELVVPESPKDGDDVTLTCSFHLVGKNHRLYTVSWWRGKDQFYTYKGTTSHDPKHAYTFRGIQVKVSLPMTAVTYIWREFLMADTVSEAVWSVPITSNSFTITQGQLLIIPPNSSYPTSAPSLPPVTPLLHQHCLQNTRTHVTNPKSSR